MTPSQQAPSSFDVSALSGMVAEKRLAEGLSVRQAATAAGVSFSTISRVEAGTQPDLATFVSLCGWLGVDTSVFIGSPALRRSGVDEAIRHLTSDPRLSQEAANQMAGVVRDMYRALAHRDETPVIAAHLRAAPMLRPGIPERLSSLLTDMRNALVERTMADDP